jgi:DNA-binding Lrp family transcriptional regulator
VSRVAAGPLLRGHVIGDIEEPVPAHTRLPREEEDIMRATAYVLISLAAGVAKEVYSKLSKMELIQKVDAVSGPYDMIAIIDGSTFNEIARFVLEEIQTIPGIQDTITCNVIFLEN